MSFLKTSKKGSQTYVYEVEGYRDKDGKVRHRYIRAVGKLDENGELIPTMKVKDVKVENVRLHGPVRALHKISEELELEDILGKYAPEIMTMVYSHVLRPESLNNIKRAIKWIDTDEIGLNLPVSRKRFEKAMDTMTPEIPNIERALYGGIKDKCDLNTIFYDISDVYVYGENVKMAKRGHGSELPQIGIGLAVEAQYGIPLFHQIFDGNVFDAKTFPVILARLQEFARKKCILVFDRGVASQKNVIDAVNSGFDVTACIALKGKLKKKALEESKHLDVEHIVNLSSQFIYAKEIEPGPVWGINMRIFVCLNTSLREHIRQRRYHEITDAIEKLKKGIKIKDGLKKYIRVNGDPQIDYEAVRKGEMCDGLYLLITTTDLPKEKVVKKYFDKDVIEKSFESLKTTLSIQPVRHWLTGRVKAHIFICYLAYLHLSWMNMRLKTNGITMSPVKALENLETIYTVKLTDEKASASTTKTVPLTKEQEAIYKALNLLS
ncbi:MAG: transposase [Theionarchaea archaeon]|nr:transposase [Theionarchaea archaeon]